MPHAYLVNMLQKSFFHSIIKMANSSILYPIDKEMPQIFLSFVPHTFHMIHSMEEINMVYEISYMNEREANRQHLLYSATNSILCNTMLSHYKLTIKNQERYISTTKAELMNYQKGLLIHQDDMSYLLDELDDIKDLRFIVPTKKPKPSNSNNQSLENYSSSSYCNTIQNDELNILCSYKIQPTEFDICNINRCRDLNIIQSKQFHVNNSKLLRDLTRNVLDKLIMSEIDSLCGIAIVAE